MGDLTFVPYNDETHRSSFFELNLEYLIGANEVMYDEYGIYLIPDGTVKDYLESVFPTFTAIKPPNGIIFILEDDGNPVGMGALKKLEDGVGEIKRMYIRPDYRGGYGKKLYGLLEDKAREFGFSVLRLDTARVAAAAVNIYRKVGFKEIEGYSGGEWEGSNNLDSIVIFMEKHL